VCLNVSHILSEFTKKRKYRYTLFMRILSGITPSGSGRLHLGNYLGAIQQFIARQQHGDELFIFVADWHALTAVHDAPQLQRNIYEVAAAYIALGLDPARTTLYRQSDIADIPELSWIFGTVASMGLLERAHAYKDKVAHGITPSVGLFTYPILMAADILIVRPDIVPVGKDQKQHIEIARDIATSFNATYGETFKLPEHEIPAEVATVPGTDGEKMSKSYGNTIDLFGTDAELKKQIMGIKTDSTPKGSPLDPDTCIVYQLYAHLATPEEKKTLADQYRRGAVGYGDAKNILLAKFHEIFDGARARFAELIAHPDEIDAIFSAGAARARTVTHTVLAEVRKKVGLTAK